MKFEDRYHAAILLAEKLKSFGAVNPVIAAIPRGAMEMGEVIASPELGIGGDLDVILVHKFTSPEHPEFALGSVTEDGDIYFNDDAKASGYLLGLDDDDLISAANAEIEKLQLKRQRYTPHRAGLGMKDRTVVIVDDGIATGATMMAAIKSAFSKGAHHVIAAAPVASHQAIQRLQQTGAEVCAFAVADGFFSVSQFYKDFSQVSDAAVAEILARHEPEVLIRSHGVSLRGYLNIPPYCRGLVVFVHGSGSGRGSPRNQFVANSLQRAGIGTLLVDLLQIGEGGDGEKDADISFLTKRLLAITDWIKKNPKISHFQLGLAWESLAQMTAPTLVIVGGDDEPILAINHEAFSQLNCESDLVIIPGATHLFDEPDALDQVAQRTREWFLRYFSEGVSEKEEMRRPRPRENSRPLSRLF